MGAPGWGVAKESIGFVVGCFGMLAGGAGVAELLHKGLKVGPNVFLLGCCEGFVLSGVSREDVVIIALEDLEVKVVDVQDINLVMMAE
jgi:hypothetical protein